MRVEHGMGLFRDIVCDHPGSHQQLRDIGLIPVVMRAVHEQPTNVVWISTL